MQHNVKVAGDGTLEAPARRLYELVQCGIATQDQPKARVAG
jgi:hypothetical protein